MHDTIHLVRFTQTHAIFFNIHTLKLKVHMVVLVMRTMDYGARDRLRSANGNLVTSYFVAPAKQTNLKFELFYESRNARSGNRVKTRTTQKRQRRIAISLAGMASFGRSAGFGQLICIIFLKVYNSVVGLQCRSMYIISIIIISEMNFNVRQCRGQFAPLSQGFLQCKSILYSYTHTRIT